MTLLSLQGEYRNVGYIVTAAETAAEVEYVLNLLDYFPHSFHLQYF